MEQPSALPLIIYHANCLDGFGAAFAAASHFGFDRCELYPGRHGDSPPDVAGRELYLLDFSYKRPVMARLCGAAARVTVLDHHISAEEDLAGLDGEWANLTLHFEQQQSGAVIAWHFFHPTEAVPPLLLDIQDRDLWLFHRSSSADITTAMNSYPFELERWQGWIGSEQRYTQLQQEGVVINRFRRQMVERYKRRVIWTVIAGFRVPVVNAPSEITSELLGELAIGAPFAASYQDLDERRGWSLRSHGALGEDVAVIAQSFGGGGHRNAAGFSTPLATDLFNLPHSAD